MIDLNIGDIPMRGDSPPKVLARAAEHMTANGTPWLAALASQLREYASDAERGKVTIDLTAAYEQCDEPHAVRGAYHVAREYLAAVEKRPTVVCLCGSTRFYDAFQAANYSLTMRGQIVLSVGFYPHAKAEGGGHGEGVGHDSAEKVALDELHKRKIDLADEVLVLNVGGYIGKSTRGEIAYAEKIGRPVRYLEDTEAT